MNYSTFGHKLQFKQTTLDHLLPPCPGWFPEQGSKAMPYSGATICQASDEFNRAGVRTAVWSFARAEAAVAVMELLSPGTCQ